MAPRNRSARSGNYSRQASRQISYKEDDSTSGLEDEDSDNDVVAFGNNHLSSPLNTRTSRASTSSSASRRSLALRRKRNASHLGTNARSGPVTKAKRMRGQEEDVKEDPPEGTIPCWQNLPYHILASVFEYSRHLSPFSWSAWLVQVALLCKSFVEPALSCLYYALCSGQILGAEGLFDLLRKQTTNSWLDYRAKIKYLDINLPPLNKRFSFDWTEILALTPQLRGIQVEAFEDSGDRGIGQIFRALESNHISLREWRWLSISGMARLRAGLNCVYPTSSMQTIERLTFVNRSHVEWGPEHFAAVVNALPRLKDLCIYFSTSLTPEVLSLLSVDLESLRLLNSKLVTPGALTLFLAARGQKLRSLYLESYSSYGLSFLDNLERSCPLLQDLAGDFSSFRTFDPAMDLAEEELLGQDFMPTWPSSLRHLNLLHLQGWNADLIFSSLLDSAASLPDLRHIFIKASLGESDWKSRIRYREKWTTRFAHVFLRSSEPPNPHLKSLDAYQAFKRAQEKPAGKSTGDVTQPVSSEQSSITPCKGRDQFSNITIEPDRVETDKEPHDNEVPQIAVAGNRRSGRLSQNAGNSQRFSPKHSHPVRSRRRRRRRTKGADTDFSSEDSALEDEFEGDSIADVGETLESFHVQGLCDVVNLQFDNLRPSEEQLRESDFLNEEVSGDEDWKGFDDYGDEDD